MVLPLLAAGGAGATGAAAGGAAGALGGGLGGLGALMLGSSAISGLGSIMGGNAQASELRRARKLEAARLAQLAPYIEAGKGALSQYQEGIGNAPSIADVIATFRNDPGYQFELEQGLQGVQGSAAAGGMLQSGRTLKDLMAYGQGLASTRLGQMYDRETNRYLNQQNQLQNLMSGGLSAAGRQSMLPQLAIQQGQNTANMYQGVGNAIQSGLSNYLFAKGANIDMGF